VANFAQSLSKKIGIGGVGHVKYVKTTSILPGFPPITTALSRHGRPSPDDWDDRGFRFQLMIKAPPQNLFLSAQARSF
jgi:hypothetical protein